MMMILAIFVLGYEMLMTRIGGHDVIKYMFICSQNVTAESLLTRAAPRLTRRPAMCSIQ